MVATDESGEHPSALPDVVRELLQGLRAAFEGDRPELWLAPAQALDEFPRRGVEAALLDRVKEGEACERLIAAGAYLTFFESSAESHVAYTVMRQALVGDDESLRSVAYQLLNRLANPPQEFRDIVDDHYSRGRMAQHGDVLESLALRLGSVETQLRVLRELDRRVHEDNADRTRIVESAAILVTGGRQIGWDHLLREATAMDSEQFYSVLVANVADISVGSAAGCELIAAGIHDERLPITLRMGLTRLLGMMVKHDRVAEKYLVRVLTSGDWPLLGVAANGLTDSGHDFPAAGIDALIGRLSDDDVEIRSSAATALQRCCPPLQGEGVRSVVNRMHVERDIIVLEKLATIAGRAGEDALRPLLALAEADRSFRNWIALFSLASCFEECPAAVFGLLAESSSSQARRLLAATLTNYRVFNGFEQLATVLQEGEREAVTNLLIALSRVGPSAEMLTPVLLETVLCSDGWRSELAATVIAGIGPAALAYFDTLMAGQQDDERLVTLRSRLESQGLLGEPADDLQWIGRPKLVQRFVEIVAVIEEEGPVGKKQIAEKVGRSEAAVRKVIEELERIISARWHRPVKLLTSGKNRAGGLSADGRKFYADARSYVQSMRL